MNSTLASLLLSLTLAGTAQAAEPVEPGSLRTPGVADQRAAAPTAGSAWRTISGWWLLPGGAGVLMAARLLLGARRRQARLVEAMREGERASQAALAFKEQQAGRERFGKDLLLALHGKETPEDFGAVLLERLCRRLDAKAAVFHHRDATTGEYRLAARYAGSTHPDFLLRYKPGEGLAGQAVLDRQMRICPGTEADWLWIESGTQRSAPLQVVVAPIVSGDHVPGVLELALVHEADAPSLALLGEILPVVALSLDVLLAKLGTLAEFARYRAMEERQRQILDHVSEGIFGQDLAGRVTFANAAALQMLGFSEEALLGQPMHALTRHHHADGRRALQEACPIDQCAHDGGTRTLADQVFWRQDGTPLPVAYTAAATLQDGVPNGAVVSFRDITQHLQTQQELARRERLLRDSEARLRTLFETANEGIWIIDLETRTTELNPAMTAILGRPREAVLGHTIFEFVDARNEAIFRAELQHRLHGATGAYEIALSRPDGSQVPCLFNASPLLDARGERSGSFAMVADLRKYRQRAH